VSSLAADGQDHSACQRHGIAGRRVQADHRDMRRLVVLALLGIACGSETSDGSPDDATPDAQIIDPNVLRVAGTYPTQVALTSSTCSGINVMSLPTTVQHTPGATTLSLLHAGSTYPGTIETDGDFMTTPVPQVVGADTHTLTMAGTFTTTGFTSTVTVVVTGGQQCMYLVSWTATRQSGMNVIPG
jgi:hypothetical protein